MNKYLFFVLWLWSLGFSGCQEAGRARLTIATAANMQFAIDSLTKNFTETTGISCETIISSSGKLTAQIKEGAPFDVFVSADLKYPTELYETGFTLKAPAIYAYGKLVMWSMLEEFSVSVDRLTSKEVKHIALANPKTAPYGVAAMEVLGHYKVLEKVDKKLVYGESIAQTNQFITSKAAEVGFTAKSVVLSPKIKGKGHWKEVDPELYSPIAQGVVILKTNEKRLPEAQRFYDFLFSEEAKSILHQFGYQTSVALKVMNDSDVF